MAARHGSSGRSWVVGAALLALLIVAGAMTLGVAAEVYAASSIPASDPPQGAASSPTASSAPLAAAAGTDDLGIRPLPLLSTAARAAWTADHAEALAAAEERVLGAAAEEAIAVASTRLQDLDFDFASGYPYDLTAIPGIVDDGLAQHPDATESDILDLAGLLELAEVDRTGLTDEGGLEFEARSSLAFVLLDRAAARFRSCDSLLAKAHAQSMWAKEIDGPVAASFREAATACPSDPTPLVEAAFAAMNSATIGNCGALGEVAITEWNGFAEPARAVQAAFPSSAAGYVAEADVLRIAANVISHDNAAPFTARAYRKRALDLYGQAERLSSSVAIQLSLARTLYDSGDFDAAQARIDQLDPTTAATDSALELAGEIAAHRGEFRIAADLESRVAGYSDQEFLQLHDGGPYDAYGVPERTGSAEGRSATFGQFGGECGGSLVEDRSFVPAWRDEHRERAQLAYAYLAQDWDRLTTWCEENGESSYETVCIAASVRGEAAALSDSENDFIQDLARRHGAIDQAAAAAEAWVAAYPTSALAHERLGEVRFLQQRWGEAESESGKAAEIYGQYLSGDGYDVEEYISGLETLTGPGWAVLRQASARRELGDLAGALERLRSLTTGTRKKPFSGDYRSALLLAYAYQELGITEFRSGDYDAALKDLRVSMRIGEDPEDLPDSRGLVLRGAQAQAASEAALALGLSDEADKLARKALEIDPESPLFQETVGEAALLSDKGAAIAAYRAALDKDPTLFSSWNNMGVLLFQTGDAAGAIHAFEQAVAVRDDYPAAWFNLGVAESEQPGLVSFVRAQGALGRAGLLDHDLKDQDPVVRLDEEVYASGIDVSRQIPAEWQLSQTARSSPQIIGLGLILMVILRIAWALAQDWLVERGVRATVGSRPRRWPRLHAFMSVRPSAFWTTACTLAALLYLAGASGMREFVVGAVIVGALLAAHALAQRLADPTRTVRNASSLPASLSTLILAPFGLGFTPPAPIANSDAEISARVRRSGVAVVGLIVVALGLVAYLTAVPVTRTAAIAGLLIVSSALVPVHPLDGARLSLGKALEIAVGLAVGGATVLLAAGIV